MRLMIDLFSGLGGASYPFKKNGWEVVTVDINPEFSPDLCIDVREFLSVWDGRQPDFLWASPPCEEFSRSSMPWTGFKKPEWWAMELVFTTIKSFNSFQVLLKRICAKANSDFDRRFNSFQVLLKLNFVSFNNTKHITFQFLLGTLKTEIILLARELIT